MRPALCSRHRPCAAGRPRPALPAPRTTALLSRLKDHRHAVRFETPRLLYGRLGLPGRPALHGKPVLSRGKRHRPALLRAASGRCALASKAELTCMPSWQLYRLPPGEFEKQMRKSAAVIISDVETQCFGLYPAFFDRAKRERRVVTFPDRLMNLKKWVRGGGGLMMVGGWLSFSGSHERAAAGGAVRSPRLSRCNALWVTTWWSPSRLHRRGYAAGPPHRPRSAVEVVPADLRLQRSDSQGARRRDRPGRTDRTPAGCCRPIRQRPHRRLRLRSGRRTGGSTLSSGKGTTGSGNRCSGGSAVQRVDPRTATPATAD